MKINISKLILTNCGYIKATANIQDKHDRSAPSHYHWKILKCRMIIFSSSSVLASPDKQDLQQIHIVFNKCGDDYDKLNGLFTKFSLAQNGEITATTPEMFQMCFHYTMTAKIAPIWNTLGENYLINNRDFLITKGIQEGIKYNVVVNDEHVLSLDLKGVKINLLNTDDVFVQGEYIRVLPSLNKAIVDKYHENFPQTSKFRCFADLRRHWKNIHGYRLPDEKGAFYSIQFWRGEPLLYPKICVIRQFPIITPMPNYLEKIVVQRFLSCLKAKMPNIPGVQINIQMENEKEVLEPSHHSFPDTQTVSLCTPTQYTKGTSYNR